MPASVETVVRDILSPFRVGEHRSPPMLMANKMKLSREERDLWSKAMQRVFADKLIEDLPNGRGYRITQDGVDWLASHP